MAANRWRRRLVSMAASSSAADTDRRGEMSGDASGGAESAAQTTSTKRTAAAGDPSAVQRACPSGRLFSVSVRGAVGESLPHPRHTSGCVDVGLVGGERSVSAAGDGSKHKEQHTDPDADDAHDPPLKSESTFPPGVAPAPGPTPTPPDDSHDIGGQVSCESTSSTSSATVPPSAASAHQHQQQHQQQTMSMSAIVFQTGHRAEFEEGPTLGKGKGEAVVRAKLWRPLPCGDGMPVEVALKRLTLLPNNPPTQQQGIAELQAEAKAMRRMGGWPPFIRLLVADTDPGKPAMYEKANGTKTAVLCIAMEVLEGDEFVEAAKQFGWAEVSDLTPYNVGAAVDRFERSIDTSTLEERVELLRQDLLVITRALLLVVQAHGGAMDCGVLHPDGFYKNVMIPQTTLHGKRPLRPYPADNGVRMIDLGNIITLSGAHSSSSTGSSRTGTSTGSRASTRQPPTFLGPADRTALVPLDCARQLKELQIPCGTRSFQAPETIISFGRAGPWNEAQKAEMPGVADARAKARNQLRARGLLVGKGEQEGVWVGEATAAYCCGLLIHSAATRGRPIDDSLAPGEEEEVRFEIELRATAGLPRRKHFIDSRGRPTLGDEKSLDSPLGGLLDKPSGLEWARNWLDKMCNISKVATSFHEGDRSTLAEIEDALHHALQGLEALTLQLPDPTTTSAHTQPPGVSSDTRARLAVTGPDIPPPQRGRVQRIEVFARSWAPSVTPEKVEGEGVAVSEPTAAPSEPSPAPALAQAPAPDPSSPNAQSAATAGRSNMSSGGSARGGAVLNSVPGVRRHPATNAPPPPPPSVRVNQHEIPLYRSLFGAAGGDCLGFVRHGRARQILLTLGINVAVADQILRLVTRNKNGLGWEEFAMACRLVAFAQSPNQRDPPPLPRFHLSPRRSVRRRSPHRSRSISSEGSRPPSPPQYKRSIQTINTNPHHPHHDIPCVRRIHPTSASVREVLGAGRGWPRDDDGLCRRDRYGIGLSRPSRDPSEASSRGHLDDGKERERGGGLDAHRHDKSTALRDRGVPEDRDPRRLGVSASASRRRDSPHVLTHGPIGIPTPTRTQ
ncbi:unnamed protein product [Vitrella brassicaformis CCMP3155]|uniref:Protein kinase domain-containing protein n=2 Tax=Vitrella brassicaformis TaxID=1169539 RepID=A0A0G4GX91_VITBC|nr:unnamed protein product [Vitrella brassicaformis CCMP3155]|eukprot:CEM35599.1 unnamed protein product [Vitrella brassicaformis CCMP3155]